MKTPIDPKEELLQQLATSLLRDVFAAAALAGLYAGSEAIGGPPARESALDAFAQADSMLEHSHTPALIEQLSKLKS